METVAGVFQSRGKAEQAADWLRSSDIPDERIALLSPQQTDQAKIDKRGFVTDGEQPGMGAAVGGAVGGAVGAGSGFAGATALVATIPGLGPIFAAGMLGAAALGLVGALVGEAAGKAYEHSLAKGLPTDEWFVYQDALRQGRSVLLAQAQDEKQAEAVRQMLAAEGAESIDAAREQWWLGLRGAEEDHYLKSGQDFAGAEKQYRMGFETALRKRRNGELFDAALSAELHQMGKASSAESHSFRMGFQRGWDYYDRCQQLRAA